VWDSRENLCGCERNTGTKEQNGKAQREARREREGERRGEQEMGERTSVRESASTGTSDPSEVSRGQDAEAGT
jgi:hypothetical protein